MCSRAREGANDTIDVPLLGEPGVIATPTSECSLQAQEAVADEVVKIVSSTPPLAPSPTWSMSSREARRPTSSSSGT